MSPPTHASDDIVRTFDEAAGRGPLLITEPLEAFLDRVGLGSGPIAATRIGDGHSNVTYLIDRGGAEFVLRRPPRGALAKGTHDVAREAQVLTALAGRARVPEVYAVADERVIGAPFYLMEKVEGQVIALELPAAFAGEAERRALGEEMIDALTELHAVDWRDAGLESFGRPTGYGARQLRRFSGLWQQHKTRDVPEVDAVGAWLARNLPADGDARIVHGDYRLGNVMLAPQAPVAVRAIFDWEMSTIGDPLADLGYFAAMWDAPAGHFDLNPMTRLHGFASADELVARYEERSGRTMRGEGWYRALALWKLAILMEGNYRRAQEGLVDDPFAQSFADGVVELADRARQATRRA